MKIPYGELWRFDLAKTFSLQASQRRQSKMRTSMGKEWPQCGIYALTFRPMISWQENAR